MVKIGKKQKSKKSKEKKNVNAPTPNAAQVELDEMLKTADSAVVITASKGVVDVRGIKNINYAYEAKGLLIGALDSYLVIPISKTLRTVNDANVRMYFNTIQEIKKAVGIVDEKPKEKKKK